MKLNFPKIVKIFPNKYEIFSEVKSDYTLSIYEETLKKSPPFNIIFLSKNLKLAEGENESGAHATFPGI